MRHTGGGGLGRVPAFRHRSRPGARAARRGEPADVRPRRIHPGTRPGRRPGGRDPCRGSPAAQGTSSAAGRAVRVHGRRHDGPDDPGRTRVAARHRGRGGTAAVLRGTRGAADPASAQPRPAAAAGGRRADEGRGGIGVDAARFGQGAARSGRVVVGCRAPARGPAGGARPCDGTAETPAGRRPAAVAAPADRRRPVAGGGHGDRAGAVAAAAGRRGRPAAGRRAAATGIPVRRGAGGRGVGRGDGSAAGPESGRTPCRTGAPGRRGDAGGPEEGPGGP